MRTKKGDIAGDNNDCDSIVGDNNDCDNIVGDNIKIVIIPIVGGSIAGHSL